MANSNFNGLRLYEDVFNDRGMTDENQLASALLTQPDVLSPIITHLVGKESDRFPLSFLTEGMGNVRGMNDIQYEYPVIQRLDKVEAVAITNSGSTEGQNHTYFKLRFKSAWFKRQYIIESPGNIQARIMEDPYREGNYWVYTLQLVNPDPESVVPTSEMVAGTLWSALFAPVAESGSRGNESSWVAPSKFKNQMTIIRKSYKIEGNTANKTMNITIPTEDGAGSNLWMDFEEFQHMLSWKQEVENLWWYSQYNRNAQGEIALKDDNGKPIPLGSGVLEQIPNYETYSFLTAEKLKNLVTDAVFGASDSDKMNIVLFTGTGGVREFDEAMKEEARSYTLVDSKVVQGSGRNLTLTGYFTTYEHVDGHTISVRKLPLFDHGRRAMKSPKHPVSGLPLESYRMVFLDMSSYDGQANVQMVTQNGREFIRRVVPGMAPLPATFGGNSERIASDIDASSVQFMKAGGINIMRATNCLHLENVLS